VKKLFEFIKRIVKLKIFQNFSYLLFGNIGMQLLNLVAVMIIAKVFKPELFGTYSFMIVQSMLLAAIADLGMKTIIIRVAASETNLLNKTLSANIVSSLIANFVLFFIYLTYNNFFGELTLVQIILISLNSIAYGYNTSIESVFLGKQKMLPIAIANIINSIIWLLFVVLILDQSISIDLFFLVYIFIYTLKPIQLTIKLFYKFKVRFEIYNIRQDFKSVFLRALPFWGLVLFSLPANYLANNFLAFNSGIDQVGFFSLSQKFTSPISMVLSLMFTSMFPNISILWLNNKEDFQRIMFKSIPLFILFGTLLVTVFLIVIDPVFKMFFSVHYYNALIILKLQIWYVFLFGVASLIGTILIAMHQDKLLFKMALLNCIIVTPILWIGSRYGGLGLSIGYLTAFVVFLTIQWIIFAKKIEIPLKVNYVWLVPICIFIISNAFYFYSL
jgi:O-antigen/teichoic acid export membrane protein